MRGPHVVVVSTRRVPSRLGPDAGPEEAWARRRAAESDARDEARREGGVGTAAFARALESTALAGEPPEPWDATLAAMRDALRDLGVARVPHLASSRALDPREEPTSVTHALSALGARRAVLVGINYAAIGGAARLRKREDDVRWAHDVVSARGFDDPEGFRVLVDDGHDQGQPTRRNITRAIRWLTRDARAGDSLLFHFSGRAILPHNTETNAETDAHAETNAHAAPSAMDDGPGETSRLCLGSDPNAAALAPCDADVAGHVTRGDLRAALVDPLPRGVRLTVVLDCPEGGADAFDLPFAFEARDACESFGVGSGLEAANGAEVGRTIVVATRANATTVETMETARRVAEGVSMFASTDEGGATETKTEEEGEGEKGEAPPGRRDERGWDEDGRRRSRSSRGRRRTPREDAAGGCCAVS
jgi:hypothetical protein